MLDTTAPLGAGRHEDEDVPRHHDDVEAAVRARRRGRPDRLRSTGVRAPSGGRPRACPGPCRPPPRRRPRRLELDGDPPGSASGVEHGARSEGLDEGRLTVHVRAAGRQLFEPAVVLPRPGERHRSSIDWWPSTDSGLPAGPWLLAANPTASDRRPARGTTPRDGPAQTTVWHGNRRPPRTAARSPGGSSARQYVCSTPPPPPMGSTATSSWCALRGPRPRCGPRWCTWPGPPRAA